MIFTIVRLLIFRTLNLFYKVEASRLVVIDLCAALICCKDESRKMRLEASLQLLRQQGVEVAIYSALDAWATRRALRMSGITELFDYVWHLDAMMAMRSDELEDLKRCVVLNLPQQLCVKQMCIAAGIPAAKVPPWMRWLV